MDSMSTGFRDQADKYIFWNAAADRASYLRARAFIWVCEAWVRDMQLYPMRPFRSLPIIGEKLQVLGCDFLGKTELRSWNIARPADEDPKLEIAEENMRFNFVKPMVAAMQKARRSIPK